MAIMAILRRLVKNRVSLLGLILLAFFAVVALAAPWLAPPEAGHDPYRIPRRGWALEPTPSARVSLGLTRDSMIFIMGWSGGRGRLSGSGSS